jgi:alpha-N-arabinofuranosidase
MDGNVFLNGAMPSSHETNALVQPDFVPAPRLVEEADGLHLLMKHDPDWSTERTRKLVTTKLLGRAIIPDAPFEQPDGARIRINTDYFGQSRNASNPTPGPFEHPGPADLNLKIWNANPTGN